ncbi:MAG: AI-2E family transporter [Bacteroidota bacterium]|nr:MAG: AI-2E family transporter [Bacteroidota bacterium]
MKSKKAVNSVYDTTIRLFIVLLIISWCLLLMFPFVSIILWSLILSMALFPMHNKLSIKMGGRPKLASAIIITSILAIVVIPSYFLTSALIDEIKILKESFDSGSLTIPPPTEKVKEWPIIGEKLYERWLSASENIEQTLIKYQDQLLKFGSHLAKGILSTTSGALQIIISLIIAGFLLVYNGAGEEIKKLFRKVAGDRGDEFADLILKTVGNVVKGIIGVALILAILDGILLVAADIPYAGILTLFIFVLAILQIPLFIITVPIIIYIFAVKDTGPAIVWTILLLIVGTSDNILRPILLGKGAPVPMLVIFIGVIGGFIISGFIGLFTGAIVMSLGYKLYIEWVNTDNEKSIEVKTE